MSLQGGTVVPNPKYMNRSVPGRHDPLLAYVNERSDKSPGAIITQYVDKIKIIQERVEVMKIPWVILSVHEKRWISPAIGVEGVGESQEFSSNDSPDRSSSFLAALSSSQKMDFVDDIFREERGASKGVSLLIAAATGLFINLDGGGSEFQWPQPVIDAYSAMKKIAGQRSGRIVPRNEKEMGILIESKAVIDTYLLDVLSTYQMLESVTGGDLVQRSSLLSAAVSSNSGRPSNTSPNFSLPGSDQPWGIPRAVWLYAAWCYDLHNFGDTSHPSPERVMRNRSTSSFRYTPTVVQLNALFEQTLSPEVKSILSEPVQKLANGEVSNEEQAIGIWS
jgi:hypothetical protein